LRLLANLHGEVEHGVLARRDIRLSIVDGNLIGDVWILGPNSQDRAMRNHAILALIGAGCCHHDHFALSLGQAAVFFHQRIVIGEERAKFVRPKGECQKDVRNETRFLLHREQAAADVLRQGFDGGNGES